MTNKEKLTKRVQQAFSNSAQKCSRIILIIMMLALLGATSNIYAQQVSGNQPKVAPTPAAVITAGKPDAAAIVASKTGNRKDEDSPALSEREKALLDRIEQLEKRLAEVESRLADKPSGDKSRLAGPATAGTSSAAASPALNASDAALKTGAGEIAQDPMKPAVPSASITPASQNNAKKEPFSFGDFTWLTG